MSKWRPVPTDNLYAVSDIHGQLDQLQLICSRIFPLRKSDGIKDRAVFLGDYIDRGPKSPEVVDFLIAAKKKYKDQLILLCGNHELMLLDALKPSVNSDDYLMWMRNGGESTLSQYLDRGNNHLDNPYELMRNRVKDFIPKDHLDFFISLLPYYEFENYIFVHGGCNPAEPLNKQSISQLVWDRDLFDFAKRNPNNLSWDKTIVTGHNGFERDHPYISQKFLMLDCSYNHKLISIELNSMECFVAGKNKDKLVKLELRPLVF